MDQLCVFISDLFKDLGLCTFNVFIFITNRFDVLRILGNLERNYKTARKDESLDTASLLERNTMKQVCPTKY